MLLELVAPTAARGIYKEVSMLCITRKHGEVIRFFVGREEFTIRCELDGSTRMKFAIDASHNVTVVREEIYQRELATTAGVKS